MPSTIDAWPRTLDMFDCSVIHRLWNEHSNRVENRYKELGGTITISSVPIVFLNNSVFASRRGMELWNSDPKARSIIDWGATYDVMELSFAPNVGLTPQDKYWLFVNTKTHLIDKWEFLLTGQKPPPSSATWESWTSIGAIQLSLARRFPGKPVMLRFENVATPAAMDDAVFSNSRLTN